MKNPGIGFMRKRRAGRVELAADPPTPDGMLEGAVRSISTGVSRLENEEKCLNDCEGEREISLFKVLAGVQDRKINMYAVVARAPKSGRRAIGSSRALFSLTMMISFGITAVTSIGCVAAPPQSGPALIEDLVATRKFTFLGEAELEPLKSNLEFCKSVFATIIRRVTREAGHER